MTVNRRRWLIGLAAGVLILAVTGYLWGQDAIEYTLQRYYGGRVEVVVERGTAIKNYLKTLDTSLRSGSGDTVRGIAPEALQPLDPCLENRVDAGELGGTRISRWSGAGGEACDAWKNLARHWGAGSKVTGSLLKMMHLNNVDDDTCEPEVRLMVHGVDAEGREREDSVYAQLTVDFTGALPRVLDATVTAAQSTIAAPERPFRDEAAERGLVFSRSRAELSPALKFAVYPVTGGGAAVGDVDGDGWQDVYLVGARAHESRLFRNVGGRFEDVTEAAGVDDPLEHGMAAVMGDVDNDADIDLIVTHGFAPPTLFRNRGDGTFDRDEIDPSMDPNHEGTTGASLADVDNDGDLDLYLSQYGPVSQAVPDTIFIGLNGLTDLLYINDGSGRFTEEGAARGIDEKRWTFQTTFADFDDDGDVDVYQVNDFGRNSVFENTGDGRFRDATLDWRSLEALGFGMSGCWGDYDVDGKLDMYVSGLASGVQWFGEEPEVLRFYVLNIKRGRLLPEEQMRAIVDELLPYSNNDLLATLSTVRTTYFQGNQLLHRKGDRFDDISAATGTFYAQWAWGSRFLDFQNDGLPDIYSTAGFITSPLEDDL
jgi:hypothetical protein